MADDFLMRGPEGEFREFYEKHFEVVYKYIYRKIENRQIAEDIAQETFYLAFVRWREVELHPSMQGWLFQTAYYKLLEYQRRIRRQSETPVEELEFSEEEQDFCLRELEMTALSAVKPDEWELVKGHYYLGYSVQDLANREGVTENNLRVRMSRILKKLRKAMGG